jgi:hypothetical protein
MTNKRIQALKDAIAAMRGTSEERSIGDDEELARLDDQEEWRKRAFSAQGDLIKQMKRVLDQHVPNWRERVTWAAVYLTINAGVLLLLLPETHRATTQAP